MSKSINDSINRIFLESNDIDLSGKYSLFTLYSDNSSMLHLFDDRETFEAMKHKFTTNDNIKRLGATHLPENTTFKKLSESIERKFNVPRESIPVRSHPTMPRREEPKQQMSENQIKPSKNSPQKAPQRRSMLEDVIRGKEKFSSAPSDRQASQKELPTEPTINQFRPASNQKIDLSSLGHSDRPMLG